MPSSLKTLGLPARAVALALALTPLTASVAHAQGATTSSPPGDQGPQSSVMLILDSSGSMKAPAGDGGTKLEAAKQAMNGLIDGLPDDTRVGLRVFGGTVASADRRRGCSDTRLVIPLGPIDRESAKAKVAGLEAKGFTPIALSLRQAAGDLPPSGKRTIVLVSDGIDQCAPPRPCDVAREVVRRGVDLRIETVGFKVNAAARRQLQCIARVANGIYRDAEDAEELAAELRAISTRAARAYIPQGTPVDGGASPTVAPVIGPGQYLDDIQPDQAKWYAVRLARGETLTVGGALISPERAATGPVSTAGAKFELLLHNPRIDPQYTEGEDSDLSGFSRDGFASAAGVSSQPVGVGEETGESAEESGYGLPGDYYLKVSLDDSSSKGLFDFAGGRPFGLELRVDVLGRKGGAPPPPDDQGGGPVGRTEPDERGPDGLTVGLVTLGLGAVGAAAGAAGGLAWRRRRA